MEIGKSSVLRIVPIQPDTGNLARVWIPVRRNSSSAQAEPSNLDSCAVELTVSSASRQGVRCLVQPVMVFQFISFKMTSQGLAEQNPDRRLSGFFCCQQTFLPTDTVQHVAWGLPQSRQRARRSCDDRDSCTGGS